MRLKPEAKATETAQPSLDNSLIPMINVVFLLLIFFLVAGSFKLVAPVEINPALSDRNQRATLERLIFIDSQGDIYAEGEQIALDALTAQITVLGWASESNTDSVQSSETDGETVVSVQADRLASVGVLRNVLKELRKAGLKEVELISSFSSSASVTAAE